MKALGPAFTALMIAGIAACLHGPPYATGEGAMLLGVVLVVSLLVSLRWLGAASLLVTWMLPIVWLVAAAVATVECNCDRPGAEVLAPEYFNELVFGLLFGALVIYWLASRPIPQQLARVRALDR